MSGPDPGRRIPRRRFLRDAGVAAGATAELLLAPTPSFARYRRRRQTVAVFGGGVAGLTVAHELAERGFDVTVYERRAWGGKARSTWVPGTARGGRKPLPGEHGFRFELGFYANLPDTLRRIPCDARRTVLDNVIDSPDTVFVRDGAKPDLYLPTDPSAPLSIAPDRIAGTLVELLANPSLPPQATGYLANRLVVYLSSCDERRHNQWEKVAWSDFIASDRWGGDYHTIFDQLPRFGQAAKPPTTSTDWCGQAVEGALMCLSGRGYGGPGAGLWRLLAGPTNDTWINPWLAHLRRAGVVLRLGEEVEGLELARGRITGARLKGVHGRRLVHADWYVSALPVERARRLWDRRILAADPALARMYELETGWMNGLKLFLRDERPFAHGPIAYADSAWAMTSVSQAQFWPGDFASTYGDGRVRESLSVILSDWDTPGRIYGKAARDLTPAQVIHEVWEQLKRAFNKPGQAPVITDDLLMSWSIDPGMTLRGGHLVSGDPLIIPRIGSRSNRPDVTTAIPNLMLAGDYPLCDAIDGTMEAANETGRSVANAVLSRAGSTEDPVTVFPHSRPPEWEPLKQADRQRYARGQPNLFDTDLTLDELDTLLGRTQELAGTALD